MVSDVFIKGQALDITTQDGFKAVQILSDKGSEAETLHARLNSLNGRDADDTSLRRIAAAALDMLRNAHVALEDAHKQLNHQRTRIEHLESVATSDELTALANRRGFVEAFDRELDRTTRGLTKGGLLLMIDLDNFKLINDTHGHAAGDGALRLVAETLKSSIRRMDMAARIGGDEFVLLFSNADVLSAVDRAQQLAMRLNALVLRWKGEKINIRASIGMRAYAAGDTVDAVLQGADSSMYAVKAKRASRQDAKAEKVHA